MSKEPGDQNSLWSSGNLGRADRFSDLSMQSLGLRKENNLFWKGVTLYFFYIRISQKGPWLYPFLSYYTRENEHQTRSLST